MKKENIFPAVALVAASAFVILGGVGIVSAYFGGGKADPAHEESQQALEDGDFQKWQEVSKGNCPHEVVDTEEEFQKLQEAHQAMQDGDVEKAEQIREELGLPEMGGRHGHGPFGEGNEEVRAAIEAGDFQKFQELTQDRKIGEVIDTEEEFNKLEEAHRAMVDGDREKAEQLHEELGLPGKGGRGSGGMHGMR